MKKVYLLFLSIGFFSCYGQGCDNGGFESGLTGYTFSQYVTAPDTDYHSCSTVEDGHYTSFTPTGSNNFTAPATWVTSGIDVGYGNSFNAAISRTHSGSRAVKLRADENANIVTMSRTLTAGSQLNFSFSLMFRYYVSHPSSAQPFFKAVIYHGSTIVNQLCITADTDQCYFYKLRYPLTNSGYLTNWALYTDWVCFGLDTSAVLGENITIQFIIGGCAYDSSHQAEVYIDDICGSCSEIDNYQTCCKPSANLLTYIPSGITENYERRDWIKAQETIYAGATAVYHAGNYVELLPNSVVTTSHFFSGFEAEEGAHFAAYVEGCTDPDSYIYRQNQPLTQDVPEGKISIVPNPSGGMTQILSEEPLKQITITSIEGKTMLDKKFQGVERTFETDISTFAKGLYLVSCTTNTGEILTAKLLKN